MTTSDFACRERRSTNERKKRGFKSEVAAWSQAALKRGVSIITLFAPRVHLALKDEDSEDLNAISLGIHRPTQPPTRPSHTMRYVSFEQPSNRDMASPRRQGWTKNAGTPVMG